MNEYISVNRNYHITILTGPYCGYKKVPRNHQQAADNIASTITMGRLLDNVGILVDVELTQIAMQHSDMPSHKICYQAIKEDRSECMGQEKIQLKMMDSIMGITTLLEEATMDTVQGIEETMEDPQWKETSSIVPYFLIHYLARTRYHMPQRATVSTSKRIPKQ